MKTLHIAIVSIVLGISQIVHAAQVAQTRLYCLSIRFGHASAGGPNGIYSLDLTGIENGVNGELFPYSDTAPTHATYLVLTHDLFEDEYPGSMLLDVPQTDNDGDGFPDLFDTSKSFNGTSSGTYSITGFGSGNVTATWSRDAGSQAGSCRLTLQNMGEPFFHIFTILEYRGPLEYTPGTNVVSGTVDLALTGMADSELKGPITFNKSSEDPHNVLDFDAGDWTNHLVAPEEIFSFYNDSIYRDPAWPTNFYGYVEFDDWLLGTAEADYYLWILSIDDSNDSDHDGIPDLSDEPENIVPRRPTLGVARNASELLLSISGDVGKTCEIQEAQAVDAASWPTILSVTLTNDPQTVTLPLPASGERFWRVRVQ